MTQIQCQHLGKRDLNETKLLIKRTVSHLLLPLMMQTVSLSGFPKICQETKDFILEGASTEIPKLHKYISCNTYKNTKIYIRSNFLFQCLLKMMFNHSSSLENCSEVGWRNKWQTMAVGRKINGIHTFTATSAINYRTAQVPLRRLCCSLKVSMTILPPYIWFPFSPQGYILFLFVASKAENGWISVKDKEEWSMCT